MFGKIGRGFMKSINIESNADFEKTVLLCVFWTTRKASTIEGCASHHIKKIVTPDNIYAQEAGKRLKLSSRMLSEIENSLNQFRPSNIEMHIGEEVLNTYFGNETFSVDAAKNKGLENEITDKLEMEFVKKYPNICPGFIQRVFER